MRGLRVLPLLVLLLACAPRVERPTPPPPPIVPLVQYGWASWYGEEFHGRRTSSGEIYNMYELTAAHRTLPFGTKVMVTHLRKGRSVVVTINDRGPFVEGRIIDLSYAAAKVLDMVEEGVAWVRLEVISVPEGVGFGYTVQVGSFLDRGKAEAMAEELRRRGFSPFIVPFDTPRDRYWRVRLGPFPGREEAEAMARRVSALGYDCVIMPP